MHNNWRIIALVVFLAVFGTRTNAMVYYDGGTDNTSAPGGGYANSGWDWTGAWQNGSGIAISPNQFITAQHFATDPIFVLGGTTYNYLSHVDDPDSDLRIVTIQESFSTWAELYTGSSEAGSEAVLYGRGDTRGAVVNTGGEDKGWLWSSSGRGTMRWGTNDITYTDSNLIGVEFNAGASVNEAALANWDSGGGMFINDGGTWKLAGINYFVTGPFDEDSDHDSGTFYASIYDKGGLYEDTGSGWIFHTNTGVDKPGSSYATRISTHITWINSQIPEPSTVLLLSFGGFLFLKRRRKYRSGT